MYFYPRGRRMGFINLLMQTKNRLVTERRREVEKKERMNSAQAWIIPPLLAIFRLDRRNLETLLSFIFPLADEPPSRVENERLGKKRRRRTPRGRVGRSRHTNARDDEYRLVRWLCYEFFRGARARVLYILYGFSARRWMAARSSSKP